MKCGHVISIAGMTGFLKSLISAKKIIIDLRFQFPFDFYLLQDLSFIYFSYYSIYSITLLLTILILINFYEILSINF